MPVSFILPVNNLGGLGDVSSDAVMSLRNAARATRAGVDVQIGSIVCTILYIPVNNAFNVMADRSQGIMSMISSINNNRNHFRELERVINDGVIFHEVNSGELNLISQTLSKIDFYSFTMGQVNFSLSGEHLTCPITLEIPDNCVFAKTSLESDVCCLYDAPVLKHLISHELPHPISREELSPEYIIPKEQCHFDSGKGAFIHSASKLR